MHAGTNNIYCNTALWTLTRRDFWGATELFMSFQSLIMQSICWISSKCKIFLQSGNFPLLNIRWPTPAVFPWSIDQSWRKFITAQYSVLVFFMFVPFQIKTGINNEFQDAPKLHILLAEIQNRNFDSLLWKMFVFIRDELLTIIIKFNYYHYCWL